MESRIRQLLAIMARLRGADGCPWDKEQTLASIAPYTIEEAYEVADAAERGDMAQLRDELGDLLFQVVFYAEIASEANAFDFEAVAAAICDKLRRRHPHVFDATGPVTSAEQSILWETIKAQERGGIGGAEPSHLDGVPPALPALMRAFKLSKRAARVGFDFEHSSQSADKVAEELAEVRAAAASARAAAASARTKAVPRHADASREIFEEVGDLLFAAANLARKLDIDAEAALRSANAKFERRFRGMESLAKQRGEIFADLNLEAQERLWQEVKRGE
ncbi:MAG: nucleoside triphosphate pyrophosphohydrolase [Steroidobacteraceae bacterium]